MSFPFFSVLPGHDLAYNEIVRPSRRWAFSYYFLHRWLPLLHPQQAMLVQVLRQCSWQQGKPTGRCQLANATLCRLMGWSESSHKTLLTELERPLSEWFVRRARTRKKHVSQGHAVEGAPRYRVIMDDPLTPRDQAALCSLLAAARPATAYEAAEQLNELAGRHSRALWALLDEQLLPATLPATPATVAEVAARCWPHLAAPLSESRPFQEVAERLQLRLTGAGYTHMELDYMMRGWLPTIGITHTWLVVALRARCFHDPRSGELRDVVTVSRRELETQLGIPPRTFRRMLRDEATLPLFHISPPGVAADPADPRNLPHRGELSFTVAYPLLPVAPADRERYEAALLDRTPPAAEPAFSTGGQPTRLEAANQPGSSGDLFHRRPANPPRSGQRTRLTMHQAASEPGSKRPANPARSREPGHSTRLEAASEPTILDTTSCKEPTPKRAFPTQKTLGKGEERIDREELQALLEPFQIKGIRHILYNPELSIAEVRGWIMRGREEVREEQMGGYLYKRLREESDVAKSDPLPEVYRLVGAIEASEAALFERWWLAEQPAPPFEDSLQRARYGAWLRLVKGEDGNPDRPDFSPHACWRREMARDASGAPVLP